LFVIESEERKKEGVACKVKQGEHRKGKLNNYFFDNEILGSRCGLVAAVRCSAGDLLVKERRRKEESTFSP